MKSWKRDTKTWTVRQIDGEPYPGKDEEGDTCYSNTHFESEDEAWKSLHGEAAARLSLATRGLIDAKNAVANAQAECVDAALAVEMAKRNHADAQQRQGAADE